MSEISKDTLLYTLPDVLASDDGMLKLAKAAAEAIGAMWQSVDLPTIYARIDQLDETLLDTLARDFKVDWYDYDATLEVKRALIRDCFYVHKHLGTKGAVERALADVWPHTTAEEWFDYSGDPYHFRLNIAGDQYSEEKLARAMRLVNIVKNVRSVLDGVAFHMPDIHLDTYVGVALYGAVWQYFSATELPDIDTDDLLADELENYLMDEFGVSLSD